jgi:hypothetical protein
MREALKNLSAKEIIFICKECSLDEKRLFAMDDDTLYDVVYETMCNIEVEEVCKSDGGEDSERCEIASDIVTALGNALAEEEGFVNEDDIDES